MSDLDGPTYTFWDLLDDGRAAEAADILRDHLIEEPRDVGARAFLALLYLDLDRVGEAEVEARQAVGEAPELAFAHVALGRVQVRQENWTAARGSASKALQLDPHVGAAYVLSAQVAMHYGENKQALEFCERGLAEEPDNPSLPTLRALALQSVEGREQEASAAWSEVLAASPTNAVALAGKAWIELEKGDHSGARARFRDALELDPTLDWAREGYASAIKSRSPLYRALYGFFSWMDQQSRSTRFLVIFGAWLIVRNLPKVTAGYPALAPVVLVVTVLYAGFVLLTWVGSFVFDGLLLLKAEERRLVPKERRLAAAAVTGQLLLALTLGLVAALADLQALLTLAIVLGLTLLPMAGWLGKGGETWSAISGGVYAGTLLLGVGALLAGGELGSTLLTVSVGGTVIYTLIGAGRSATR